MRIDPEETGGKVVDSPLGDNQKGRTLAELLDDLPPSEPVVVFCRFRHDLDVIRDVVKRSGRMSFELSGRYNELAGWQQGADPLYICNKCSNRDLLPYVGPTTPCNMAPPEKPDYCPGTMKVQTSAGDVLAVQIQAGGVGIDLSRAAYCVYFSMGYNLGDYLQSLARLDRPGQTRSVTYIHLVARDTIDEKVYAALQNRQDVIEAIIEGIKGEQPCPVT